jgi:hypothetical protein
MKLLRGLSLLLPFTLVGPVSLVNDAAGTTVIQAKSCEEGAVQNAVDSARNGDVVAVPAGHCTWTATVRVTAGITLKGAGADQTIVVDETPGDVVDLNTAGGRSYRVTGFTFRRGHAAKTRFDARIIHVNGETTSFRIDNNTFDLSERDKPAARSIHIQGSVLGVIDHNRFLSAGGSRGTIYVQHPRWGGGNNSFGDGSWADESHWGTGRFVFIEDNTFRAPEGRNMFTMDSDHGGRFVFRHNTIVNGNVPTHGTETGGRSRGSRAVEIYRNRATHSPSFAVFVRLRAGTGLIFDNNVSGFQHLVALNNNRSTTGFGTWKSCDGTFPFDDNDAALYDSGTHNGTSGELTLTDTTKAWRVDAWARGYSVRNVTKKIGSYVTSNTANTITLAAPAGGKATKFDPGDRYEIRRATVCMDAPGSGKGELLSGHDPGPKTANNQVRDPVYVWNNVRNGEKHDVDVFSYGKNPHIVEGRDFFNNVPKPGYTPFVYPHPLVSGTATSSAPAPTDLKVQ